MRRRLGESADRPCRSWPRFASLFGNPFRPQLLQGPAQIAMERSGQARFQAQGLSITDHCLLELPLLLEDVPQKSPVRLGQVAASSFRLRR